LNTLLRFRTFEPLYTLKLPNGHEKKVFPSCGDRCDWCATLLEEAKLGVAFRACCGNCKLAFYCSRECQEKDWKEGCHKYQCRKKGEFKPTDTATYADPSGVMIFGAHVHLLVRVKREDTDQKTPKKWLVADANMDCTTFVLQKNLRRQRPAE
jgi:MYND finger